MTEKRPAALEYLYYYRAKVVHIYDGDTMTVDVDLGLMTWHKDVKLRLEGIDTPELRGDERPEGLAVRDKIREWLPVGTEITIQTFKDEKGKFGRWLARIWLDEGGESLNAKILKENMARPYNI